MKTKITHDEVTYWVGMTDSQMRVLRFAMGGVLLAKETDLPLARAVERQGVTDAPFMWETILAFEKGLEELAKSK